LRGASEYKTVKEFCFQIDPCFLPQVFAIAIWLEHLQGTLQMDFAFVVVCKVPNQTAKSKNRLSSRDFANGLGNY
jgi:hypothetical protein